MHSSARAFCYLLVAASALWCAAAHVRNPNRQQLRTIEKYLDGTVDPCEDYYQYACGNWELVHGGNDYSETIGYIDYKIDHEYARLLQAMRKRRKEHPGPKFVGLAIDYYRSCMAVDAYSPLQYLQWLQQREAVKWPSLMAANKRGHARAGRRGRGRDKVHVDFDWLQLLAVLRRYGLNGVFIEETVIQRGRNARTSAVDIDKPVLNGGFQPMPRNGLTLILDYLGADDPEQVDALWEDVHSFEEALQNLDNDDDVDDGNKSADNDLEPEIEQREVMLSELKMPWLERYLSIVLQEPVSPHMNITVQNLPYLRDLLDLLGDTEPEFVCRYLMLRFLWFLNVDGPRNFLKTECVSHTRSMLPLAMHWLYEQENAELLQEKDNVETLFVHLLTHFIATLDRNANRFDAAILKFLRAKADRMQIKIGNLPRPNTTARLEEFYQDLSLQPGDFYANHLQLLHFYTQARHRRLSAFLPQNDSFFHLEDQETGASSSPYYLLRSNMVIVPLTLLHLPIYNAQLHGVFKYSSLGFLLSHEITHAFDDSGVEFDQRGNMLGPSEGIKANALFDANLTCLRAKNPQIIDEKIADVSGLRLAYEAYFQNASSVGPLPFTDLSAERLFFLNFAQFFCGANETSTRDVNFSEHGSDRQRVLDALANFGEFGRVYECPVGSRMHPEQKCQLWR